MRTNTKKIHGKPSGLAETLFSDYRRRILALLLLRSEDHYHVREISRLTGVPAGSLHRELKLLADAGLLSRHSAGNQVRYQANRDCPIFNELAESSAKPVGCQTLSKTLCSRCPRRSKRLLFSAP